MPAEGTALAGGGSLPCCQQLGSTSEASASLSFPKGEFSDFTKGETEEDGQKSFLE